MSARTDNPTTLNPYRDFDFAFDDAFEGNETFDEVLTVGERICLPSKRSGTMLPAAVVIAVSLGGGWAALATRSAWEPLIAELTSPPLQQETSTLPEMQPATAATPSPVQEQTVAREITEAPGADAGTPMPETAPPASEAAEAAAEPEAPAAADETAAPDARLTPPTADPSDPNQQRAEKIGLHPGVSKSLLKRMSPDDYRNAGFAIKTALAETPDGDVFVWPRKAEAKLATFEVRFVQGAPLDCRRYVVTVTKDRWSTTAPPMEKCGLSMPARRPS